LDNVFADANVDNCIITFVKTNADKISLGEMRHGELTALGTIPAKTFAQEQYIINISIVKNPEIVKLLKKIEKNGQQLNNIGMIKAGLKAYETGKGTPTQTEEMKKQRIYHANNQKDKSYKKYLLGKNVCRYSLVWSGQWLKYGKNLAAPRQPEFFSSPRILIRQIPSPYPNCINAVYTDELFFNDINSMILFNFKIDPLYLLGVLNSRLMSFWFINKFDKFQRGIFPQFKVKELGLFPIAICNKKKQKTLIDLADTMISLHNDIQLKRQKFLRRVTDNFDNIQPLGLLEHFDRLEFKEFLAILLKRKARFRLNTQAEWEEFFNEYQSICRNIIKQIVEIDYKIDQLVYELYGLTENEIKIIEATFR
jgi:hypothetical protein